MDKPVNCAISSRKKSVGEESNARQIMLHHRERLQIKVVFKKNQHQQSKREANDNRIKITFWYHRLSVKLATMRAQIERRIGSWEHFFTLILSTCSGLLFSRPHCTLNHHNSLFFFRSDFFMCKHFASQIYDSRLQEKYISPYLAEKTALIASAAKNTSRLFDLLAKDEAKTISRWWARHVNVSY